MVIAGGLEICIASITALDIIRFMQSLDNFKCLYWFSFKIKLQVLIVVEKILQTYTAAKICMGWGRMGFAMFETMTLTNRHSFPVISRTCSLSNFWLPSLYPFNFYPYLTLASDKNDKVLDHQLIH